MGWADALLFAVLPAAATGVLLALWRRALLRWQFLDRPNRRSSHTVPTPTGGGVAVMLVVAAAWLIRNPDSGTSPVIVGVAVALCVVSWLDDIRNLPPALRLGLHLAAVLIGFRLLWPALGPVLAALPGPAWLWGAALVLAWAWFINLYNFMDGIDGITGVETLAVALGVVAVAAFAGQPDDVLVPAAIIAGAAAGFLVWNWHPAKLFLGDSGSVPLGFLLGWLLLRLAVHGAWPAALILPLYYLADATLTLGRRALRRERLWQAHRDHFYQQAVRRGLRHDRVALRIAACNVVLVGAAVISLAHPLAAIAIAVIAVGVLLWHLAGGLGRGTDAAAPRTPR